jgi:GH15 family glucan-1,4-alpha-glucosidase
MLHRRFAAALAAVVVLLITVSSRAEDRTWNHLTTGNGHGFQVFDANKNRINQFLEHPYRFLRRNPTDEKREGPGRRNLAFDVYFGLKGGGGAGWLGEPTTAGEPEYVDQSNIIRAPAAVAGVNAESFFFSPFGIERNVMVGVLHAAGASDGYALFNFHMGNPGGSAGTEPDANGESTRMVGDKIIIETGAGEGAMIYVPIGGALHASCQDIYNRGKNGQDLSDQGECGTGNDISVGFQKKLDAGGWMGFAAAFIENANEADTVANEIKSWIAGRSADKVLNDAKAEFEAWRKPPPEGTTLCSDDEKKVWRMGEATLRMGQVREANIPGRKNHGMVLASLPIGEWHTGWVRDATYALVAMARSGHYAEARAGLDFFMNAEAVGKYPSYVKGKNYRISVTRYFGTGEEETDWNQDGPNIEIDGWGLVLWAARQYVQMSGDKQWLASSTRDGSVWDVLTKGIAEPLEGNLEPASGGLVAAADASIWEVHEAKKKHFAYTTLTAARGFCDMAALAKIHKPGVLTKYQDLEKKLREGFLASFQDPQGGLAGSLEELGTGQYIDAAVAESFSWNILRDYKSNTAKQTLVLLERMRVDSGGYKRNDDGLSSYDNNEWILVDFRIANAYRRAGDGAKADGIVAKVVQKAAKNFYLLPELYNSVAGDGQVGKYTGSVPMVGYGGGAYMMTVLDRSGGPLGEVSDCGDTTSPALPKIECNAISTNPGSGDNGNGANGGADGANGGGTPGGEEIPFVGACLCKAPGRGGAWQLSPAGVVFVLAMPVVLFFRRRRSRVIAN